MTTVAALAAVELVILGLIFASFGSLGFHHTSRAEAAGGSGSHGPFDVHTTIATSLTPRVRIDDDDAHLFIKTASVPSVRVDEVTTTSGHVWGITQLRVERMSDGSVFIGRSEVYHGRMHREITVTVPAATTLEVTHADSVTLAGLRGSATITGSNDDPIDVSDHTGSLDVKNGDGRVTLSHVRGDRVAINNSDGNVDLNDVNAVLLQVRTGDGHISANGVVTGGGSIQSGDGRVSLTFDPGTNVTVGVKSDASVTAVPPLAVQSIADDKGNTGEHQVRIGSGAGRLDVQTGDGSVTIAVAGGA